MVSVKFTYPNQSNCEAGTICMTLTYDSADLTCLGVWQLGEHTLMYLRGAGGWTQTQMGEGYTVLCMCSFLDKALFLTQEKTSTHLQADQTPLVNSVLSTSWVEADDDADMDKSGPQLCEWTNVQQGLCLPAKLISLVTKSYLQLPSVDMNVLEWRILKQLLLSLGYILFIKPGQAELLQLVLTPDHSQSFFGPPHPPMLKTHSLLLVKLKCDLS